MRIGVIGSRGVPASYSGVETGVEQLGKRLAKRGHSVTVYCRRHHIAFEGDEYEGMELVKLPTIRQKHLETIVHSLISSIHACFRRFDIILYVIAGNSPVTWIPRLARTKTVLNVNGLDWRREKWGRLAKRYIRFSETLATLCPNAYLTDSAAVQRYFAERFRRPPLFIPYGSEVTRRPPGNVLRKFGLEPRKYLLFVGRLVPENHVDDLIRAFRNLTTDLKCVIVGDATYADDYKASIKELAEGDSRVVFTGYQFGPAYEELGSNAYSFVYTSDVGGTHPAILEAMAFGNCVIVRDTLENLETIGDAGLTYDDSDPIPSLSEVLSIVIADPATVLDMRERAKRRVEAVYSWETVTDKYETMFHAILAGNAAPTE